jgi:hypothetical protein
LGQRPFLGPCHCRGALGTLAGVEDDPTSDGGHELAAEALEYAEVAAEVAVEVVADTGVSAAGGPVDGLAPGIIRGGTCIGRLPGRVDCVATGRSGSFEESSS